MLTVIQRVTHASVTANQQRVGEIKQGIVALFAIEKLDTETDAKQLIERILNYRVFADNDDKMNFSLRDIKGGLLLIPQFTLAANTKKGNRPSFSTAAPPTLAKTLFEFALNHAQQLHPLVSSGIFGADMQVSLCNDGPVTFTLKSSNSQQ